MRHPVDGYNNGAMCDKCGRLMVYKLRKIW